MHMQLPLSSFKVRLIGFLGILLSTLFTAWIWQSWNEAADYVEAQERGQVQTLVQTLAPLLDGELHERAVDKYDQPGAVDRWSSSPMWLQYLRQTLVDGVHNTKLETPIYTLRLKPGARESVLADRESIHTGVLEVVLTSDATPAWRHSADYLPEMGDALFDRQVATTDVRADERGSWISAFAPVCDAEGQVVGLLRADASVSNIKALVKERLARKTTFGLMVLLYAILGCVLLTLSITRSLTRVQQAAQRLSAGDYTTPFPISNSSRELRDLTEAFESARARMAAHIEAQERLNSALETTRVEAESANRAKSLFLANMSHDLRTPLNAIIGFIQVLRQSELDTEQREIVDTVRRASEALHTVVGDMLDFARISEGRLELAEAQFDVRDLIQETGERLLTQAKKRGLELTWAAAPDVPMKVHGDPSRLRQVLTHLIDNAIKFTEIGSVHFTGHTDHADADRTALRFEVVDTGSGIPPERLGRLFEPFTPNAETGGAERGTGMGLSLCRSLCQLLGGEIGVDSRPGHGSTFWFTVNLGTVMDGTRSVAALASVPAPLPHSTGPQGARKRILIAEDSAVNRRIALHMVRRLGYDGEVAVDGIEALDAVRCEAFDVILMDCQMPRMDGFEATQAIRALGGAAARTPIIAFTATAEAKDREHALALGMVDVITKPVAIEKLGEALERWSGSRTPSDAVTGAALGSSPPA
ncbi:MAG: signal transduction histidine kinase/CheY-like chemotaxis protein [Chlamydiales bacterium]|jgi:signal transduction histidine kinase/CheY-like chemotaxis protein